MLLFLFPLFLFAQNSNAKQHELKGKVVDENGEVVLDASIYIEEISSSSATNHLGEFSVKLPAGTYTVQVRHISFQNRQLTVQIPSANPLIIRLAQKEYILNEVSVSAKSKDPALNIMRKAIAKAPYYRNRFSNYRYKVYSKASLKVDKLSKLFEKMLEKEGIPIKKNGLYVRENINEVTYNGSTYQQKILSTRSSFPKELNDGLDYFGMYNIYSKSGRYISPLSPEALAAYRFQLINISYNDYGKRMYHIKFSPKNSNPYAFTGSINIVDSSWHVHYFELTGKMDYGVAANQFTIKENFEELEKDVWMPSTYYLTQSMSALGAKGTIQLSASIKYQQYTLRNPKTIPTTESPKKAAAPVPKKVEKISQKIEKIVEKEKLNNQDVLKMVSLIEKQSTEEAKADTSRNKVNELEIKRRHTITMDSLAQLKDSVYWEDNREIPLTEEEEESYVQKQVEDSIAKEHPVQTTKKWFNFNKDTTLFFGINTLNELFGYNPVDGVKLKLSGYVNKKLKDETVLSNHIGVGYSFLQKQFIFSANIKYTYYPKKLASIALFGGNNSFDFNHQGGVGPLVNSLDVLFFKRNSINVYRDTYLGLEHKIEAFNGFDTRIAFSYGQKKELHNMTDYAFFYQKKRTFAPNIPDNPYVALSPELVHSARTTSLEVELQYTPRRYYRYSGKTKRTLYSKYPTFSFLWKKGIPNFLQSSTNYDYLQLSVQQRISKNVLRSFHYAASGGWFPNNKQMHFSEFQHFNVNSTSVKLSGLYMIYNTLNNYQASTNEWMFSGFFRYETLYLLFKYIPGLNKTLMKENLYVSYLRTPYTKGRVELGYSLNDIFLIGYIGVFVGFEELKYAGWNLKVGIQIP